MSPLAILQQSFQQRLLQPRAGQSPSWISCGGRATPQRQLGAYLHAYPTRLKEVLEGDFPAVRMAVGNEAFEQLALAYIDKQPSRHFSLREFGVDLPDFLGRHAASCRLEWLSELARFEWQLYQAFDAADGPVARIEDMAAIAPETWPDLRFELHPSVRVLSLAWNAVSLWQSLTADAPEEVMAVRETPVHWLIWRDQLNTRFRSLATDEAAAFDCLVRQQDFGELCLALTDHVAEENLAMRAASLLKGWISEGLVSNVLQPAAIP